MVEVDIGILMKEFPFTYLVCTIFHMRNNKFLYEYIMNKISTKLQGWNGKILSYGERAVLVKHVL